PHETLGSGGTRPPTRRACCRCAMRRRRTTRARGMSTSKLKPGSRACRCSVCGEYFGGEKSFDLHRVGPMADRRCLPRSGMQAAGLELDSSGYWRRRGPSSEAVISLPPKAQRPGGAAEALFVSEL